MTNSIVKWPNLGLRQRTNDTPYGVSLETAEFLLDICADNAEHLVGLSSVQMDKPGRVIVFRQDRGEYRALIDPLVVERSDTTHEEPEGCGSLPDVYVVVRRPESIVVRYQDKPGSFVVHRTETFTDFEARVILHEIDHLDGILIIDYGTPLPDEALSSP